MENKFEKFDLKRINFYPLSERKNLVKTDDFGKLKNKGLTFSDFFNSLPNILAGSGLKRLVNAVLEAKERGKIIILAMGAHPIKCGTSPYLIELVKRGIVDFIASNGALLVHDLEIALIGETSEDVQESLKSGRFGMSQETSTMINKVINQNTSNIKGLGGTLGEEIIKRDLPNKDLSLSAACYSKEIPLSIHIGIGTDINHIHPDLNSEALGRVSHEDFKLFITAVSQLNDGGVFINFGSAVIIPEVFLKALSAARNAGIEVERFTTANLDFIQHYRPTCNIVQRPTIKKGSQGIALTGHHEIMIPLFTQAIIDALN